MIELDRRTVWGLRLLQALAGRTTPMKASEMAGNCGLTVLQVSRVLRRMREAGWVALQKGRGWRLLRAAGDLTVNQILRLLSGGRGAGGGCRTHWQTCPDKGSCPLAPLCLESYEGNRRILKRFTVADLAPATGGLPECLGGRARARR
jgi:DNA-binding IscR family transcriptional regulator